MDVRTSLLACSLSLNCILLYLQYLNLTDTASCANQTQYGATLALTQNGTQSDVATSTEGFTEVTGDTTIPPPSELTQEFIPKVENDRKLIIREDCWGYKLYYFLSVSYDINKDITTCENIDYNRHVLNISIWGKDSEVLLIWPITTEENKEYHSIRNVQDAAIHTALRRGNSNIAKQIIDDTADVNIKGLYGQAPLHLAAWRGDESLVSLLISKNANINASDDCGDTPIHYATQGGHLNVVKILLDNSADVNIRDAFGTTPLYIAVGFCYESIVNLMLSKNANMNIQGHYGDSTLHLAVYRKNMNMAEVLLNNGANVNIMGTDGYTPLMIAASFGDEAMVSLLLSKNASVDIMNKIGLTALHLAVYRNSINKAEVLLNNGANVNIMGTAGYTPLMIATKLRDEAMVSLLLSKNASVDIKNRHDETALYLAVFLKNINIVKALINNGANVNTMETYGCTPLMMATEFGDEAMVGLLLSRNVSLEIRDKFGNVAIHYAARSGNIKVIEMLLDSGANINSIGEHGETPLHFALRNYNYVSKMYVLDTEKHLVMQTLFQHGADLNAENYLQQTALHKAAALGYARVVDFLLSWNASFSNADYVCFTPLQWAASSGNIEVVKTLLEHGDDVNRSGCNGVSALHIAIRRNDTDLIEYLLSKADPKADPNVMSEDGQTPLDLTFDPLSEKFMKLLLARGAKVEDNSFLGSKILLDAVSNKSIEIVRLLLNKTEKFNSYPTTILNHAIGTLYSEGIDLLISHGANLVEKDVHGNLPLTLAVVSNSTKFVNLILKTGKSKISNNTFQIFLNAVSEVKLFTPTNDVVLIHNATALHVASFYGLKDIAEMLKLDGASLEVRDGRGYSPLHYACENDHAHVVKLLLRPGSDKSPADVNGTTPLHITCRKGLFQIVKLLLSDPPAAVNLADNSGYTALHFAAMNGSLEIAKLLLTLNADKEAKTIEFKTPLHLASRGDHWRIVRTLLEAGAEKDASDIDGMTPLHFAARKGSFNSVKELINFNAACESRNKNGSTPLHLVCERGTKSPADAIKIISLLVHIFADVNAKDHNQMTPLHIASIFNSSRLIRELRNKKADTGSKDSWLNLPIHYAAFFGHYDVILELLRWIPEQTIVVNNNKETPLFLAAQEGHNRVVAFLLQAGMESIQPDTKERTALHRSAARGHFEVVKLLRQALLNTEKEDKWGFTALNYAASWKGHQEVIGYLSATQLNITLSHYLKISNPSHTHLDNQTIIKVAKFPDMNLRIPYFFKSYSGKFRYIYSP